MPRILARSLHMRWRTVAQAPAAVWVRVTGLRRRPTAASASSLPKESQLLDIGSTLDQLKLRRLQAFRRRRAAARGKPEQEPALRSELFSAEQMEQHGHTLASQHRLSARASGNPLLARLADNEAVLIHACERLTVATRLKRRITPAAEWLLDNFYLIEEQIRIARRHLPQGYSRELPRLENGP